MPAIFSPSLTDLTDDRNIEDAAYELDRAEAAGEAALAAWARKWGRDAIDALRDFEPVTSLGDLFEVAA